MFKLQVHKQCLKPEVRPEETVLLTECYKHEQEIKSFGAHATQTASQVSAAWLSGTVNQRHGPRQKEEV